MNCKLSVDFYAYSKPTTIFFLSTLFVWSLTSLIPIYRLCRSVSKENNNKKRRFSIFAANCVSFPRLPLHGVPTAFVTTGHPNKPRTQLTHIKLRGKAPTFYYMEKHTHLTPWKRYLKLHQAPSPHLTVTELQQAALRGNNFIQFHPHL